MHRNTGETAPRATRVNLLSGWVEIVRSTLVVAGGETDRAILKGMVLVTTFVLLAKVVAAAKEMILAAHYGVSETIDAYIFIFTLLSLPVSVWFSVLSGVLIPLAGRIRREVPEELPSFRSELLGASIVAGVAVAVLSGALLQLVVHVQFTGLAPSVAALTLNMTPILASTTALGVLIGLLSTWTMSAGRHANTLLEGMPALCIAVAVLAFGGGVAPLVWGTVVGFLLQLTGLAIPLRLRGEIELPRFRFTSPHWRLLWQGFSVVLLGQVMMSFTTVIDQFFAAHLGIGAISTLGYANRVLALVLGLIATAVGRSTLPVLSACPDPSAVRCVAIGWARFLLLAGLAATLAGWWAAPWIVRVVFERGAFSAQDAEAVTQVLRYGMVQLPFYCGAAPLVQATLRLGRYHLIVAAGFLGVLTKLSSNALLVPLLGVNGIALSTSIMYGINATLFLVAFSVGWGKWRKL